MNKNPLGQETSTGSRDSTIKRLLIVDDEETLTFSLYQMFINSDIDCQVVTASSGEEALERLAEGEFDLVITDLAMPGIDGLQLLSSIKQRTPRTHVIIITAYGSDERRDRAYELGADYYLEKPFDIHELRKLVFKIIG
ncbi:MAG: response regulator [Calditrichaeota bacterium]|nr:MAG: response regulator [Calditrichota bacterium]